MKIVGLQKFTLIDFPGNIACSIFLHGCNLRCGFCHNPGLVTQKPGKEFSQQEILDFLGNRKDKLTGICISGGEPMIDLDTNFLKKIKQLGYKIKIDTNGLYPDKLSEFLKAGLIDYVALDIKSSKDIYNILSGREVDMGNIEQSIKLVTNMQDYELRTTVLERYNTKEDMLKMAKWLNEITGKKPKRFCLQPFVKKGELVDISFKDEPDTSEQYLSELKQLLQDYFEEIHVKV